MKKLLNYFNWFEIALWGFSVLAIAASFTVFDRVNYLTLVASLIGVTSLIFSAKGNPIGQVLMIVFSVLYGIISYFARYYGEMITYLGMTLPMAVFALVSWLKNPFKGRKSEVKVNVIKFKEICLMLALTSVVTLIFYFVLKALDTNNLIPSTVSVTTSFVAVYLTFRRSPYFALAYALNDVVLIVLWALVIKDDYSAISVLICFIIFLINDLYGFFSWLKMEKRQKRTDIHS